MRGLSCTADGGLNDTLRIFAEYVNTTIQWNSKNTHYH